MLIRSSSDLLLLFFLCLVAFFAFSGALFLIFIYLVDVSDIFNFFLFRGAGREVASEEVAGGGGGAPVFFK